MAESRQLGYAVIGLGHFGEHVVLPGFRDSRKAKLVALVSGDKRKAKRLARKFGASASYHYHDLGACLSDPQVEAVYIATNNSTHVDFTLTAAAAGKHVLCEKPMANNVSECQQMIDACRSRGVRLMIAYRKYFEPASRELKGLVDGGKLGNLRIIHSAFSIYVRPGPRVASWHFDKQLAGGGALPDVGVYCINTACWLANRDPLEVEACQCTVAPDIFREVDEHIAFRLNFPGGLVMQATASWGAAPMSFLRVIGEKGYATLDPAFEYDEERRLYGKIGGRWFEKKYKVMNELALELDALAEAVHRNRDPEPGGAVGLRDVAVMQAVYEAARTGHAVPFGIS